MKSNQSDQASPTTAFESPIGRLLGLNKMEEIRAAAAPDFSPAEFLGYGLNSIDASYRIDPGDLEQIPETGPVVVVCNHPFGALDGIILGHLLLRRRSDVKILTNFFLQRIEQLRPVFLAVDPFLKSDSTARSVAGLRQAVACLKQGELLAVLPSGSVSHFQWKKRKVCDPPWRNTVAGLIMKSKATVVPIHISGRNSLLFQCVAQIHPYLRAAMIPREFLNKRGRQVSVRIGEPIEFADLPYQNDREALTQFLYSRTYGLAREGAAGATR